MAGPHQHPALCKVAMFLAGFIMLTPHRIAMTCAPHILKRYHLPPDVVGLFIYKIHTPMELLNVLGQYIANIIVWLFRIKPDSIPKNVFRGFSIVFVWSMFASGIISYKLFKAGDDYGKFNEFFWSIILMTFTNGLYCASAFKLEGMNASMYGAGIPASGFFTFFQHHICSWLSVRFSWEDFDRSILKVQFWITILILGITAILWSVNIGIDIKEDSTATEDPNQGIDQLFGTHAADWSPIFMLACSLGTVYIFYPSISPYQLVDSVVGKKIDLAIQFIANIPTFIIAALDIAQKGPGGNHWNSDKWWWHLIGWLGIIPYVLFIHIFISLMHFPNGRISKIINNSNLVIGIICVSFNTVQEWLEAVGFAGAGAQTSNTSNPFNGDIAAFNVLLTITIVNISIII